MDQETAYKHADRVTREIIPEMLRKRFTNDAKILRRAQRIADTPPIHDRASAIEARKWLGVCKTALGEVLGFTVGEVKKPEEYKKNPPAWLSSNIARAVWCASTAVGLAMLDLGGEQCTANDALSASVDYARRVDALATL